jgi:hypothetical protein
VLLVGARCARIILESGTPVLVDVVGAVAVAVGRVEPDSESVIAGQEIGPLSVFDDGI